MASQYSPHANESRKVDAFEAKKSAINECLKQFNDFCAALNELCNRASLFAQSMESLGEMAMPESIGVTLRPKIKVKKFKCDAHLLDSLNTVSK